jgi:hypothetical protein
MRRMLPAALLVLAAVSCGSGSDVSTLSPAAEGTSPTATEPAPEAPDGMEGPPPFQLRYGGEEMTLEPSTWCYERGCVDGVDAHPPSIGDPASVRVHVPIDGWRLEALFGPAGGPCAEGRRETVDVARDDDGWFTLEPLGDAGDHVVQLFANGDGGDMVASFAWRTPTDGPHPAPTARAALIAMHDGVADSYGVEIELRYLAETPKDATATVTITAANGESKTFEATQADGRCRAEGEVYFDGPDAPAKQAAALGDAPFDYEIVVRLDGTAYKANATYPADVIKGNEPSVSLTFDPPLPAA